MISISNCQVTRLADTDEAALFITCVHESAHQFVAFTLGLNPRAFVATGGEGICCFREGSPLQMAATAIAGILAEDLTNNRPLRRFLPDVALPLTPTNLWDWFKSVQASGERILSREDWELFSRAPTFEAVQRAFEILDSNRDALQRLAQGHCDDARHRATFLRHDSHEAAKITSQFAAKY